MHDEAFWFLQPQFIKMLASWKLALRLCEMLDDETLPCSDGVVS